MKFGDLLEILQQKERGKIVIANSGAFYVAIGRDAILLNKLLGLKLTCLCKDKCKVGFPKSALDKYKKLLKRERYSYIVYDINNKDINIEILEKYEGQQLNEIKECKKECYLCKNELKGYTQKEDKYIKILKKLREKEKYENE